MVVHEMTVHVRWGELDPYNHLNHAVYLSYMEQARIEFLDSIGWGMDRLRQAGAMIFVVGLDVRFHDPAKAGDTLVVTTEPRQIKAVQSRWHQEVLRCEELLVGAEIHAAIVDLKGRPRRIPAGFKATLEEVIG
ncbi:MAG: acyl-CoA thioesterase [Acidimicrobiia bacterium]